MRHFISICGLLLLAGCSNLPPVKPFETVAPQFDVFAGPAGPQVDATDIYHAAMVAERRALFFSGQNPAAAKVGVASPQLVAARLSVANLSVADSGLRIASVPLTNFALFASLNVRAPLRWFFVTNVAGGVDLPWAMVRALTNAPVWWVQGLEWGRSPDPQVAGYQVFYRPVQSTAPLVMVNVGTNLTWLKYWDAEQPRMEYYVRAYTSNGLASVQIDEARGLPGPVVLDAKFFGAGDTNVHLIAARY